MSCLRVLLTTALLLATTLASVEVNNQAATSPEGEEGRLLPTTAAGTTTTLQPIDIVTALLGKDTLTFPILVLNIIILVLLVLLLVNVKALAADSDTSSPAYYAYEGSSYDNGSSGYHKRSGEEARGAPSPSMLHFLTRMATNAIAKYAALENEE